MIILEQSKTQGQEATGNPPHHKFASANDLFRHTSSPDGTRPQWGEKGKEPFYRAPDADLVADALKDIPPHWSLAKLELKAPKEEDWNRKPFIPHKEIADAIRDGETCLGKTSGKPYRRFRSGYGLRTGDASGGLLSIDVDGYEAENLLQHLSNGDIPGTVEFSSGKPGRRQLLFQIPDNYRELLRDFTNEVVKNWAGISSKDALDFRYNLLQSGLPPSYHPDNGCGYYYWVIPPNKDGSNVAEAPQWLLELLPQLVAGEKLKAEEAEAKREEKQQERRRQRERVINHGAQSPKEFLEEIVLPRLSAEEIFNWTGHKWQSRRDVLRGNPPWRVSQSGESFHVFLKDGEYRWRDHGLNESGDAVKYRWWLRNGEGSGYPNGKDYVEIVEELANDAGLELPNFNPKKQKQEQKEKQKRDLEKLRSQKRNSTPRTFKQGERLDVWANSEKRYVVDSSATGLGKSYSAGQIWKKSFKELSGVEERKRGFTFVTSDPRNVSAETLSKKAGWKCGEGRHTGLKHDQHGKLRSLKDNETEADVSSNCHRTQTINQFRNAGFQNKPASICGKCPFGGEDGDCKKNGDGDGYGYLANYLDALTHDKNIFHPDGLPSATAGKNDDREGYDYKNRIVVWDEWSKVFKNSSQIEADARDIEKTVNKLTEVEESQLFEDIKPFINELKKVFSGEIKQPTLYGWSHQEIVKQLAPKLPDRSKLAEIIENLDKAINPSKYTGVDKELNFLDEEFETEEEYTSRASELTKDWLVPALQILSGETGHLTVNYGVLTITRVNQELVNIAHSSAKNIFMDATGDVEFLRAILGVSMDEIDHVAQEDPDTNKLFAVDKADLSITQVCDLGRLGQKRGGNQQKRANAVIDAIKQQSDSVATIRFKKVTKEQNDRFSYRWYIESRATNDLETVNTLILEGTPTPNLEQLRSEFACAYGRVPDNDDEAFRLFIDHQILAEIHQSIGRLRTSRRKGQQLQVFYLGDYPLDFPAKQVKASEISWEASTKEESFDREITGAIERLLKRNNGVKPSLRAIAKESGKPATTLSYHSEKCNQLYENTLYIYECRFVQCSEAKPQSQREIQKDCNQKCNQSVTSNCNRPDLVASFKKAVVAIWEKGGNITKVQLARELGCSRKHVSENREALQQAVEELETESPPPKFEANEEAECCLEGGDGQFDHYPVVISKPLHWVPSKGWLYLVCKVGTTQMRKVLEKDLKGTKNVQSGKTKKRSN